MPIEKARVGRILPIFDCEDEKRAEEKYSLFRSKLIRYFERHKCLCSEDLADETLYRVVNAVFTGTEIYAHNPFAYFWAVADNVRREERKRRKSEPLTDDQSVAKDLRPGLEQRIYLQECLQSALAPHEQALLRSFYLYGCHATSKRLGVSLPNLRLKLHRIRNKIRRFANTAAGLQQNRSANRKPPRYFTCLLVSAGPTNSHGARRSEPHLLD